MGDETGKGMGFFILHWELERNGKGKGGIYGLQSRWMQRGGLVGFGWASGNLFLKFLFKGHFWDAELWECEIMGMEWMGRERKAQEGR